MNPRNKIVLSAKASQDLRTIAEYSINKFGIQQTELYRDCLLAIFKKLSNQPEVGREYIAIKNKMLSRYRFKAHTIFFHPINDGILIVRVLGNSMSFIKHLIAKKP